MTIILPDNYHAQIALEENQVQCITRNAASSADIRALQIGILNIMPQARDYEYSLLHPLGRSILQINPIFIKLESHQYKSTLKSHLDEIYITFDQALKKYPLDGLIITGAPVEELEFTDISYWTEIKKIITDAKELIPSTLGICWGALAIGYTLGFQKINYQNKHFGIFKTVNLNHKHRITGSLDDHFWMPQSRLAGFDNEQLELATQNNIINLLAKTIDFDYVILESKDHKYLMNLGHLEYEPARLIEEYTRDKNNEKVIKIENFNIEQPINLWRCQRNEFFQQWLKYCHEETHRQSYTKG